jgi:hypothetical protein
MPFDTTSDTTQGATCRNGKQPRAKKSAYLSRLCNVRQPLRNRYWRIVALEKVAGSSPVGHPPREVPVSMINVAAERGDAGGAVW